MPSSQWKKGTHPMITGDSIVAPAIAEVGNTFVDLLFWRVWTGKKCIEHVGVDTDARNCVGNAAEKCLKVRIDFVIADQAVKTRVITVQIERSQCSARIIGIRFPYGSYSTSIYCCLGRSVAKDKRK